MSTTKLSFTYTNKNLFDKVKKWAEEYGYKIEQSNNNYILLQKGSYWSWLAHPKLMVENEDGKVTLEVWINPIWGGRMEISSDNPMGFAAKSVARNQINKLLQEFDQKPII